MPTLEDLQRNIAYQGEIRNTPRNMLGGVADVLDPLSKFLARFKLPESIPLLGGADAADLTGVKGSQGLLNDMSYGKSPIQGASLQTTSADPRLLDLAGLTGVAVPAAKGLGRAALREGARQIETGTGLLGRNVVDPRMNMFAGIGAKTADRGSYNAASKMKEAGIPDREIHAKTGWTYGFADGKPRFEIDDSAAKYKGQMPSWARLGNELPVEESFSHGNLYSAYPDTASIKLVGNAPTDSVKGSFDSVGNRISVDAQINPRHQKDVQSTTLHELQHAIQQREGFAMGGSPDSVLDDLRKSAPELYASYAKDNKLGELGFNRYRRLAGETEARLTQSRMNMTGAERAASYPPSMFDVPVSEQIVRYGDGQAMSVPAKKAKK